MSDLGTSRNSNTNDLELVSFRLGNQVFGVPVSGVQEVVPEQPLARIPRSHPALAGLLNLRGQIVTAVDLRNRLGVALEPRAEAPMNIVVSDRGELFSLVVDSVGDVLQVPEERFEGVPGTLHGKMKEVCRGVCKLDSGLVMVVDVSAILDFGIDRALEKSADHASFNSIKKN
jgi:purine-binding chemotaxis protein CheW